MKSYLHHLENNEAILLMYLADELSPQDRAEVDQMLASDPNLRSELDILRQTQTLAYDALESLDAITRPVVLPSVAHRRVGELMRSWIQRRYQPAFAGSMAGRQLPWRRIGVSLAASLMIGYYIWAVYHPNYDIGGGGSSSNPVAIRDPDPIGDEYPQLPPHRDLSNQEKLALLSIPMDDSATDESNFHVAEVAAVTHGDADFPADANVNTPGVNTTGEP